MPGSSSGRCSRGSCGERAVIDQPYAGAHLCRAHLGDSVWERFRREMHRQAPGLSGGTFAVALSGGKDSSVLLSLVQRYFSDRRDVEVVALSVDEGIPGYRPASLLAAQKLTRELGLRHHVVSFEGALGTTTDTTAEVRSETPCAFCGVWRRQLLNRTARELGASRLALGFNLDDLAQTVLMNLVRGEPGRLAQMAPHVTSQPGLVPRLAPLATIPEREIYLYARLSGLPFDHQECPHAPRAARNLYRELLWRLEESQPGARHALLRTREKLLPALLAGERGPGPARCPSCGEPSSGGLCRACQFLAPTGETGREAPGPAEERQAS